jgi:hypothetical protein
MTSSKSISGSLEITPLKQDGPTDLLALSIISNKYNLSLFTFILLLVEVSNSFICHASAIKAFRSAATYPPLLSLTISAI